MDKSITGKEYKSLPFAYKIKYWADKYNATPNGWVVASLIQQQHRSESSKKTTKQRKQRKK